MEKESVRRGTMTKLRKLKNWIKSKRYSKNRMVSFVVEWVYDLISMFNTIRGVLTNRQARAVFIMKLRCPERVHQTTPATAMNRFPAVFSTCRDYFDGKTGLKILSFGCSTGEEVLTLRSYFPDAVIVGAEINPYSLEICRKRCADNKMIFIESTTENIAKYGPYDAVFCMAVFQRTPGLIAEKRINDLSKIYPFHKFETQICELDNCVKEEGLFVVHFSQYDLKDTKVASKYSAYGHCDQSNYGSYVFDKNSKLIVGNTQRKSIFVKVKEN